VHAGLDEIIAQPAEHIRADISVGINRRNQIGKYAMKIGHGLDQAL
jgi:hypothetical protein